MDKIKVSTAIHWTLACYSNTLDLQFVLTDLAIRNLYKTDSGEEYSFMYIIMTGIILQTSAPGI